MCDSLQQRPGFAPHSGGLCQRPPRPLPGSHSPRVPLALLDLPGYVTQVQDHLYYKLDLLLWAPLKTSP